MARRTKKQDIIARLERAKAAIAKQRNILREIADEAEELEGLCSEAVVNIESAADTLSQYI